MARKIDEPARRRLLGMMGCAGFGALAGCGTLGGDEESEATFDVRIQGTNGPVRDGGLLEIETLVENVGDSQATDEVTLSVSDIERTRTVSLGAGEQEEISFEARVNLDSGRETFEATVETATATSTQDVTIFREPYFEVEIIDITDELVAGERFEVRVGIENRGGTEDTQAITLDVVGLTADPDSVETTLGPGASTVRTLTWDTTGSTFAEEITILSDDESTAREITVIEPPSFTVDVVSSNESVVVGETFEAAVTVENTGGTEGTTDLVLSTPDRDLDSQRLSLDSSEQQAVTLSWTPESADVGSYDMAVDTGDASAELSLTVERALERNESAVRLIDELYADLVEVTIANSAPVEHAVVAEGELELEETFTTRREVTVPANETRTVSLKIIHGQDELDTDSFSHDVRLDHGANTTPELADYERLAIVSVDTQRDNDQRTFSVGGTVENVGSKQASGTARANLRALDGEPTVFEATSELDLEAGETGPLDIVVDWESPEAVPAINWSVEVVGVLEALN